MRTRIIVIAIIMAFFSVGCSSSDSTPTSEGESQDTADDIDSIPTNPLEGIGPVQLVGSGSVSYTHLTLPTICSV